MRISTIKAEYLKTICWNNDTIVDWARSSIYSLDGSIKQHGQHYPFDFDSAVSSADGTYAFIYKKLRTKGLLLKNGELIKEINRSYYCADSYEFPVAFTTLENKTYLIHCPLAYNQLDFEDVETGEIITNVKGRAPDDRFHSRLEVSPDGTYLMSKGWVWHPLDEINVYNIKECIKHPFLLDIPQLKPEVNVGVSTASFVDNDMIVIGSSDEVFSKDNLNKLPPKHLCLWDFKNSKLTRPVKPKENFGNLFAIDVNYAWDLFRFPKIIDLNTGEILEYCKELYSGDQESSILTGTNDFPAIIFSRQSKRIAIMLYGAIKVLTPDLIFVNH